MTKQITTAESFDHPEKGHYGPWQNALKLAQTAITIKNPDFFLPVGHMLQPFSLVFFSKPIKDCRFLGDISKKALAEYRKDVAQQDDPVTEAIHLCPPVAIFMKQGMKTKIAKKAKYAKAEEEDEEEEFKGDDDDNEDDNESNAGAADNKNEEEEEEDIAPAGSAASKKRGRNSDKEDEDDEDEEDEDDADESPPKKKAFSTPPKQAGGMTTRSKRK